MRTIIILAAVMLAAPAAAQTTMSGGWGYAGSHEPDNAEDDQQFMWTSPAQDPLQKNRIYFNGFSVYSAGIVSLGANVNVATLHTRNQPSATETYVAILGNWVDCNLDGYVGFGELGLREYDAALLSETSLCPPGDGPEDEWDGSHNYNGWVSELIPVGTDGGQFSSGPGNNLDDNDGDHDDDDNQNDLRIIRDIEARVWGDYGLPTTEPDVDEGEATETCPITPFPRGTMQDTGGIIDYADCHALLIDFLNIAFREQSTLTPPEATGLDPVPLPGAGDPLGLRFTDANDGRSSPLGRIQTLGSEDSAHAAVTITDCDAAPLFDSSATFNETNAGVGSPIDEENQKFIGQTTGTKIRPASPGANTNPTSWTVPGQVNATNEEATWVGEGDGADCDTSNDDGRDVYGFVEDDHEGSASGNETGEIVGKRAADFNMEFEDNAVLGGMARGAIGLGLFGIPGVDRVDFPVHGGSSGMTLNNQRFTFDWFARVALVKGLPSRGFPTTDAPSPPADHITYYASVGASTLAAGYVTPGGTGTYGASQCQSYTSDVHGGWNCDPDEWYLNGDGSAQPETQGGMARVGTTYQFRDVDCEDGGNDLGVATGFGIAGVPCAAFSS